MTRIFIIYTGGTIGMVHSAKGNLIPFDFEQIKNNVPELERFNYEIHVESFQPSIDSSNITIKHWEKLALCIQNRYDEFDGFVILHGSDTMAYTASALSFMFENLDKPVILTGSQLPIGEVRTDAKENLITAIEIAAHKTNGKPTVPEVAIYFDYRLMRGNRSMKFSAEKFEAFESPNYPVLAEAGVNLNFHQKFIHQKTNKNHFGVQLSMDTDIVVLKMFPGITENLVNTLFQSSMKAIIIETFGAGNTTTQPWFVHAVKNVIQSGKHIVDISQCVNGSVDLEKYETGVHLAKAGVISGKDMTFEACLTKMMYLLPQKLDHETFKTMMETSIRGELSHKN